MRHLLTCLSLIVFHAASAPAAVFQYSIPVQTAKNPSQAFLWIPPKAQQVRGVVMAGMTLMEREFVKDPNIRAACEDQQIALIFLKCGLSGTDLQKVLDEFASVSGYGELSVAPLMFVGHSAGGPQARDMAPKYAGRCFGLVQYRGGPPWDAQIPAGIPTLMMVGQFDEFGGQMRSPDGIDHWERTMNRLGAYRKEDEKRLSSMVVEPGAGHFPWSDRNGEYLGMWIRKAAATKIPKSWPIDAKAVTLNSIDPKSGWLTGLNIKSAQCPIGSYEIFPGDKGPANWHFDEEMARATQGYHHPKVGGSFGKKDQFIKWTDGYWVDAGARYFFTSINWVDDGQTFEVHPVYAEKYPTTQKSGGPRWPQAGEPVGHSSAPIKVKMASGPVIVAGEHKFRMHFDNLAPATEGSRVTFMAFSEGDQEYRYTEHVGMLPRGFGGIRGGKDQTITFSSVADMKADGGPVELKAASDAGLPVEFYVAYGPAKIEKNQLVIADLPARAKFPIEVKVVAYQFGRGTKPEVKTAAPVEQTFKIEKRAK